MNPPYIPWPMFNYDTTPAFTMIGTECIGRVVQIHDGDTMTIILPLFTKPFKFSVRLAGIDTCEITSKIEANNLLAVKAKNRLFSLVISPAIPTGDKPDIKRYLQDNVALVYVKCYDFDKYGRLLADVSKTKEETPFSAILLQENLAYIYDGKKKLTEEEQITKLK